MKDKDLEARTCHRCERVFVSAHGLAMHTTLAHKRRKHKMKAKAVRLPHKGTLTTLPFNFCPKCGLSLKVMLKVAEMLDGVEP